MKAIVNVSPLPGKKSTQPAKLVMPKNNSSLDTYDLKQIFRANALAELGGLDVTKRTPEVNAALERALTKTETALGSSLVDTIKNSMFEDVFSSAQYRAKDAARTVQDELEDDSPQGLMD